ncbi:MAG: cytochrome P450 [Acidimicrobiaceae bacterium]|nr:cytochrome P450 [Acidimicrobiaceae bacterium]MXW74680.1 cytochrome P450 [Acidimicrobiaceae bacterium]MYA75401.1 cytochrome P450 [Acidimicrobiaceae bacterium]MYC41348.1 cytochrome P450 [Acidimicrobiaceae bacterium]MYD05386.1 cytochrome P450 [Acidimicrobiaceae bacterium]
MAVTDGVDLWDMDAFQRQEHHDMLERLRETDPGIHWIDEGDTGPGYWAVTRLAHLKEVNRNAEVFSSNRGGTQMRERNRADSIERFQNDAVMLTMDPPKHTRYRRIVSRGFTPRMINLLEDYLLNRTDMIIDKVSEQGHADFVNDLSAELPLQAIAEMVGIPLEDRSKIFDWTNTMIGADDPDFVTTEEESIAAYAELFAYSNALQTERRKKPADDIVTTLLSADVDGEKLTDVEFDMFFLLLCVAGNETTRNSITHGMHGFFQFPDQWEKYCSDPDRYAATMTDEVVRWATPVLHFRRQATKDYELGGVKIKENDKVVMWHISANRDPRAFKDPWRFDIERTPNEHVGFGGGGPHFCLGANLARMEIRLMFKGIAERLPDIRLAGDVDHLRSNFIGGVKRMPVEFTPTPSTHATPLQRLGSAAGASGTTGYGGSVDRQN